jgi:hypothetical protein
MKKIITLLFLGLSSYWAMSQACSNCNPSFVSTCPPAGGLCNKLDTAYANNPYDKVINFFMPKVINDPALLAQCGGCSSIQLKRIDVTGVSGLPGGSQNPSYSQGGSYNVAGGDSLGCARFCGTALVPGIYPVTVYLLADVTAIGTQIGNVDQNDVPQSYIDTFVVLPDTVLGVSSFTYGNNGFSACNSITLDLKANKQAPQPNLTRWFWDLGNGTTTEVKEPGQITYTNTSLTKPDTFPVALTTIFYNYRIKSVCLQLSANWYPDINEGTNLQDPEPYLRVINTGFQSHNCSNTAPSTKSPCYNNINQVINEGTFTADLEVWDDDNCGLLPFLASADDNIDNYTVNMQLGTQALFPQLNNSTGTVVIDTVAATILRDTLWVVVNPTPEMPEIFALSDTFCSADSLRISVAQTYDGYSFEWYRDTIFLTNITDSAFYTRDAGLYRVKVTNIATGCSNESTPKKIVKMNSPSPSANVIYNGTQLFVTPYDTSFAVDWYFNGNLVSGQNGKFLPYLGNGVYNAEIYNKRYPACRTIMEADTVVSGIEDLSSVYNLNVFPNPNNGSFTIQFSSEESNELWIEVQNMIGEVIYSRKMEVTSGLYSENLSLNDVAKGVYFVSLKNDRGSVNKKVIIQ